MGLKDGYSRGIGWRDIAAALNFMEGTLDVKIEIVLTRSGIGRIPDLLMEARTADRMTPFPEALPSALVRSDLQYGTDTDLCSALLLLLYDLDREISVQQEKAKTRT